MMVWGREKVKVKGVIKVRVELSDMGRVKTGINEVY